MFPHMGVPDAANTAWVLTSAALVLLMTPALAFFYGGMVRAKSVLNMMMMCFSAVAVVWVLWVAFGYSMAFGTDIGGGLLGDPFQFAGLQHLFEGDYKAPSVPLWGPTNIPALVFVMFQAGFAMVTVALIAGAVADRMRFLPWIAFTALWATLVYFPVAHWVFAVEGTTADKSGWLANLGVLDFAGGTAVEINSGAAGLALAIVLGKRRGWPREAMRPHNLPAVMLGAGLLWFGWFGFNAGSALAADGTAAIVIANTLGAGAMSMAAWLMVEKVRHGKPTSFGAASGVVAGLVAITPSCAAVTPIGALVIGAVAGAVSSLAIELKYRLGYDDSLDVVGVHLVGGVVGTLMIGVVGSAAAPAGVNGLLYGGGLHQFWLQLVGVAAVLAYSVAVTGVIGLGLRHSMGIRSHPQHESDGLDDAEHAESAYELATTRGGGLINPGL
ncbi:ammonium transporter [Mycobacteroides chelonae]|jgi:Amt family ammonium transporter|uniref:Ammonium transporter n=1 Tax=Mycobacteroides chelonae TaxID=1774 RepID=A0AB73TWL8_MYCCH|nr:ammonium transporter [Mycobacteroides chelonae]MBF9328912.1 ammonium transporter [Mycobacteroides chelonae]MBF9423308.1 ammonium transporter [Mycobacteroides chelonae]MBF9434597.1 ammonium transporter [Mycobacteroides chelonae]MBV6362686.1 ammonium transporter [Mycobacteroides chelonae]MEC4836269.1 ammonium transporter [Mycobacteroides chelonae]